MPFDLNLPELLGSSKALADHLPSFLKSQRWFAGKSKTIISIALAETAPLDRTPGDSTDFALQMIDVLFSDEVTQRYCLALAIRSDASGDDEPLLATIQGAATDSAAARSFRVVEATSQPEFWRALLRTALRQTKSESPLDTNSGPLHLVCTSITPAWSEQTISQLSISPQTLEQSNSAAVVGPFFLKLFRRLNSGINPEAEIGLFLTGRQTTCAPSVAGLIEYRRDDSEPVCLAVMSECVEQSGDAWQLALHHVSGFLSRVRLYDIHNEGHAAHRPDVSQLAGEFLDSAQQLGQRTADLHLALASDEYDEPFSPVPFTASDLRRLVDNLNRERDLTLQLLHHSSSDFPEKAIDALRRRTDVQIANALRNGERWQVSQIRCHGDFHLGQVLRTADDFVIIDFEGEPDRPLSERRRKWPAMKDVAGMIRSLHYAAHAGRINPRTTDAADAGREQQWLDDWFSCISSAYLASYLRAAEGAVFLPADPEHTRELLNLFLLEKVLYEVRYEIQNRPDWLPIPLQGLAKLTGLSL